MYYIYIEDLIIAKIEDCETAREAYYKTRDLANLLNKTASLVDDKTCEIIEFSADWEDYEPIDIDNDMT